MTAKTHDDDDGDDDLLRPTDRIDRRRAAAAAAVFDDRHGHASLGAGNMCRYVLAGCLPMPYVYSSFRHLGRRNETTNPDRLGLHLHLAHIHLIKRLAYAHTCCGGKCVFNEI